MFSTPIFWCTKLYTRLLLALLLSVVSSFSSLKVNFPRERKETWRLWTYVTHNWAAASSFDDTSTRFRWTMYTSMQSGCGDLLTLNSASIMKWKYYHNIMKIYEKWKRLSNNCACWSQKMQRKIHWTFLDLLHKIQKTNASRSVRRGASL